MGGLMARAMLAYEDAEESLRGIISVDPEHADGKEEEGDRHQGKKGDAWLQGTAPGVGGSAVRVPGRVDKESRVASRESRAGSCQKERFERNLPRLGVTGRDRVCLGKPPP